MSRIVLDQQFNVISLVLATWNNSPRIDIAPLGHISHIPSEPVIALYH
jgi:hypothetical protein